MVSFIESSLSKNRQVYNVDHTTRTTSIEFPRNRVVLCGIKEFLSDFKISGAFAFNFQQMNANHFSSIKFVVCDELVLC
jgi:hypothetical protein